MEFNGQYLTYEEYQELGGTIPRTPFNLLEFGARKKIDEETQFRLKQIDGNDIPQEVKVCDYYLINSINKYLEQNENINTGNKNIASESIDGYSVSFNNITLENIASIVQNKNVELTDIIYTNLIGVIVNNEHILGRGVKC